MKQQNKQFFSKNLFGKTSEITFIYSCMIMWGILLMVIIYWMGR